MLACRKPNVCAGAALRWYVLVFLPFSSFGFANSEDQSSVCL